MSVAQEGDKNESVRRQGKNFVIIKAWDKTLESLQKETKLASLVSQMGFDLATLVETLNKEFPQDLEMEAVLNSSKEKIEDVGTETLMVNNRPLDRLLVIAYPSAANPNPSQMTQFKGGGEVILVTEGKAEITFAPKVQAGTIAKQDLVTEKVGEGDLIVSTDIPNNWTKIHGDKFIFIYFVGNVSGNQRYKDIPKEMVPVE